MKDRDLASEEHEDELEDEHEDEHDDEDEQDLILLYLPFLPSDRESSSCRL
jgi:hypothetical protein